MWRWMWSSAWTASTTGPGQQKPWPNWTDTSLSLPPRPAGGSVLAAAATDAAGRARLTLPADLFENGAGTYTFYLRERPGSDSAMTYDPTVYTVGVTVREVSSETVSLDNGTFLITIRHLAADAVTVTTADGVAVPCRTIPSSPMSATTRILPFPAERKSAPARPTPTSSSSS